MRPKFLFRMENVGETLWKDRFNIVKRYFETQKDPFVDPDSSGFSKSDFDMMQDALGRGD